MSASPLVPQADTTTPEGHLKEDSGNTAVGSDTPASGEPKNEPIESTQTPKDIFTPSVEPQGPTEEVANPAPPVDGEEKHDWEVVNASPSHSPSKDEVNANVSTKWKGKEKEKSANGTFSEDGKIGQKIDGVRKVLKSGVFGSESRRH
jgi:hypothetical protein